MKTVVYSFASPLSAVTVTLCHFFSHLLLHLQQTTSGIPTMSMLPNNEPCTPTAIETDTAKTSVSRLQSRISDPEQQIESQEKTNTKLHHLLSEEHDILEEESFQQEMLEFDLNQHKEAITEVLGGLRQRDQTIQAQSDLLRASWLDSQTLASSQRQMIQVLQRRLEELSANGISMVHNGKKRKFSE